MENGFGYILTLLEMEKKHLLAIIDALLLPLKFKRKGACWMLDNGCVEKHVDVQKSAFGNSFYINYGYILKSVPLDGLKWHLYHGLGSQDSAENQEITSLLNQDSDVSDTKRSIGLIDMLSKHMIAELNRLNTEEDILAELQSRPDLNNIPLVVKNHFGLSS